MLILSRFRSFLLLQAISSRNRLFQPFATLKSIALESCNFPFATRCRAGKGMQKSVVSCWESAPQRECFALRGPRPPCSRNRHLSTAKKRPHIYKLTCLSTYLFAVPQMHAKRFQAWRSSKLFSPIWQPLLNSKAKQGYPPSPHPATF
jgi:hypothetical protein